ncbi:hypothetical protein [Streptomyces longwoodensis]|uniref:hypothetical protein n=1 Tax=Streptomyces longwoodensis TaxID=68231 RepID=UPI0037004A7B
MEAYVLTIGPYYDLGVVAVLTDEQAAKDWVARNPAERAYDTVPLNEIPANRR